MNFNPIYKTLLFALSFCTINAQNDVSMMKNYGGEKMDYLNTICYTENESFVSAGYSYSNNGSMDNNQGWQDAWIIKTNKDGITQWSTQIGGNDADVIESICESGSNIIAAGWSLSQGGIFNNKGWEDGFISKLDQFGNTEWIYNYGGSSFDRINQIINTQDGGFLAVGQSHSNDGDVDENKGLLDVWVLKINQHGSIEWSLIYGGSDDDYASSVVEMQDGSFSIVATTNSLDGDISQYYGEWDLWILNIDTKGEVNWKRTYGGEGYDYGLDIEKDEQDNLFIGGQSFSSDFNQIGNGDGWILKLNSQGEKLWENKYGSENNDRIHAFKYANNQLHFVGSSDADAWYGEVQPYSGEILQSESIGGSNTDNFESLDILNDKIVIAGNSKSEDGDMSENNGNWDMWVVEMNNVHVSTENNSLTVYPNIVSDFVNVISLNNINKIFITNMNGQLIYEDKIMSNKARIDFDVLASGTYVVNALDENGNILKSKFVKP